MYLKDSSHAWRQQRGKRCKGGYCTQCWAGPRGNSEVQRHREGGHLHEAASGGGARRERRGLRPTAPVAAGQR